VEYANSRGTNYSADHTEFNVGASGALIRGTDILYAGQSLSQKKRTVDTEEIAAQAIEYFRMAEQIAPIESGEMPVIFTPGGLIALLLSLGLAVDGKSVYLGASPLQDKLGQQIASPSLTILDDPFIEYGSRTSAFDDEGIARKVTPLIEKGVLRNFIYDQDTAGRAGTKPTGHGSTRNLTNLVINPGNTSYETMIRNTSKGLLVHAFLGLGQGNPINGEFSVNVFLGYKIENGKLVGRVKDVMLAGNAFEALKDITAISKEREWVSGPWVWVAGLMPYIQVGKLSVTAK
jgi:PmbA protein